jgi:hypothetical protein
MSKSQICLIVAVAVAQFGCTRDSVAVSSFGKITQMDSLAWARVPRWAIEMGPRVCAPSSRASGCVILEAPQEVFSGGDLLVFDKRQGLVE